jgi:hypothetical protein
MKNFKQIDNLPIVDLKNELENLIQNKIIYWPEKYTQICINTLPTAPDSFQAGLGSLYYNWDAYGTLDENGNIHSKPSVRKVPLKENDFNTLCSKFKNTLFEEVYNEMSKKYVLGRIRIMKSLPKTCLSWHVDNTTRLHLPIKTQEGCFMVIEDEVFHMKENAWWWANTTVPHTAFNASLEERIHLVAVVLDEIN